MKVRVVAVGRIKDKPLRAVVDDYARRIERYARFEEVEARDDAALERCIDEQDTLVALDVGGQQISSEQFAQRLQSWGSRGKGVTTFCIGGAEGLPLAVRKRADVRLGLSTMTLPHRLARLVLFEQLYRGFSILRGEPYAREG